MGSITSVGPDALYDVIIIGGSYAGLSAALTLYRAIHRCLILDSRSPRNVVATATRLMLGWEGQNPEKTREVARAELRASGLVDFADCTVKSAQKLPSGEFEVIDATTSKWRGKKILLAMGVEECYPDIEGYAENYGTTIYFCMFCYGYEDRGSRSAGVLATGVLSLTAHAMTNARDARKFAHSVTIFTNGNTDLATELAQKVDEGMKIDNVNIRRFVKDGDGQGIVVEQADGTRTHLTFLIHKPDLKVDSPIVKDLGVEHDAALGIKVRSPFNQTNIDGVYAAGDCCSPLRNIPNAMSMGAFAGCGLARELPATSYITD